MKALSLIQPWAWAVARGHKHLENRIWTWLRNGLPALRRQVAENERIAIHASSTKPRPHASMSCWVDLREPALGEPGYQGPEK